ncbi:MAG: M81 family metallopeptidase [Dongiaceae bacterium]
MSGAAAVRVFLAGLFHETHCFVPERTGLDRFRIERGEALCRREGDGSQIDGFLEVARRAGWEVHPGAAYTATPSGIVEDRVFEQFWGEVEREARIAAGRGLDAIYLSLHGAMVTESLEDAEGELLARLRALPGLAGLPLFGVFDLHANFSAAMARHADGLVCYRENPHVDARDAGKRAAELLRRALETGQRPAMHRLNPPILWPPTGTGTADSPMRDLEALAREIEAGDPAIWAVNVVGGFSFADARDAGVSFSMVTTGGAEAAQAALERLAAVAHALRARGLPAEDDLDAVLRGLPAGHRGPVLLVEPSDNIGGGAPGDGTAVLRALVRHAVGNAAVVIDDPGAVRQLAPLPIGGRITLPVGGKGSPLDEGPLEMEVELLSRSDGRFELEDINSHLAASQGRTIEMGPCAVVRAGGIRILLTSRKTPPFDLGQLRSQGIVPETLSVIGVKAAVAHRRAYDPIAAASFTVSTPGPCSSDPRHLPYRRLRRPIFPLDPV